MKILVIINDPPYGTERVYNALRLVHALQKKTGGDGITVFLMADAVTAAQAGQRPPNGYYSVEQMLARVLAAGGRVWLCGTCMDARGLQGPALMEGARRSSMDELAAATIEADKVIVF
jgi:uncharacterized protein involved in oxidation of intracellular sulfur